MRDPIKSGLIALALLMSLAQSAAATSTGDAPAAAPTDWGHAFRTGFIAAGLWIVAYLLGRLWIRVNAARAKESHEMKTKEPRIDAPPSAD
jgi:hypothetical protein